MSELPGNSFLGQARSIWKEKNKITLLVALWVINSTFVLNEVYPTSKQPTAILHIPLYSSKRTRLLFTKKIKLPTFGSATLMF